MALAAETAAEAAGFKEAALNTAAENSIDAWRKAHGAESKAT